MELETKKQGKESTGNIRGTRITIDRDNSAKKVYHIICKNGIYYVYSPNLTLKRKFTRRGEALKYIESMNCGTRYPIYEQNEKGIVVSVKRVGNVKTISSTDTEKVKPLRKRKTLRKIYAE